MEEHMSAPLKFSSVLIGGQSLLIQCAERLLEKGHSIKAVITAEPDILKWAERKNIRCLDPASDLVGQLRNEPFDLLFSIANFTLISEELLALPRNYAINFHDGILPDRAGLNVPTWALMNEAVEHGISWHIMTAELDKGDILKQKSFPTAEGETSLTLNLKCYEAGIQGFNEMMDELEEDRVQPIQQDFSRRAYFGQWKRPDAAGLIDWTQPAKQIDALVRALDFGPYWNPLGLAKMEVDSQALIVKQTKVLPVKATVPAGTITKIEQGEIHVATGTQEIAIVEFSGLDGAVMHPENVTETFGLKEGDTLPILNAGQAEALTATNSKFCRKEQFWVKRLADLNSIEISYAKRQNSEEKTNSYRELSFSSPAPVLTFNNGREGLAGDLLLKAFALFLSRISGKSTFKIPYRNTSNHETVLVKGLFASHVPLFVDLADDPKFHEFQGRMKEELSLLEENGSYAMDLILRHPDLGTAVHSWHSAPSPVVLERVSQLTTQKPEAWVPASGSDLTIVIPDDGQECLWVYNQSVYDEAAILRMQEQFETLLKEIVQIPDTPASAYTILSEREKKDLLENWNSTRLEIPQDRCVHHLFEEQVQKTPDAVALVFQDSSLTYRELNSRANQMAHCLMERNVGPDDLVAVLLDRSIEMLVAMLGIMKAGGAYVPLDPVYPKDRLEFMVEDAQVSTVLTQEKYANFLPDTGAEKVQIDSEWAQIAKLSFQNPDAKVNSKNLAYVIYTSGSTGRPKGVMVEHRNVVNFFAGMDQRLKGDPPGVWLAVTSLSFDISVLELFWTLARGFKVVLYAGEDRAVENESDRSAEKKIAHLDKKMDFSLFYFAADAAESGTDKYQLLFEGAKYGDENGFQAVWTPERHFHAFGGLYPSPATMGAALAVTTKNVKIRAGSCVLPLHSPIRIAEDWSLVDNLSNGRVGVAFASGWHPNDFVLMPQNFADRHQKLSEGIDQVRALWRGESLSFPGPLGEDVTLRTLPRPIQPEFPIWITAAGNPETFRLAGKKGTNILTHLLGQSVEEVAEKIRIYRESWREAGHTGEGYVTLMLHTFVADDEEFVRAQVKGPLKEYLRTAGALIQKYASSFPTTSKEGLSEEDKKEVDEQFQKMSKDDMEAMLEHAYIRYYETSGLFGTPESCVAFIDRLKGIGVDDVACLIDFGVPADTVLKHLPHLNQLRKSTSKPKSGGGKADYSIPALIRRHQVTHLQCTPSMAGMLTADPLAHDALGTLKQVMVGGEAFPTKLASELRSFVSGDVINMYGPTETTIWSSTHALDDSSGAVPIGRPIANTQLYVLDKNLQPVPVGVPGELFIAGDSVVRGYLFRSELTDERFVPDPFSGAPRSRMYRTGDLVRYRPDGVLEFLGRMDHQVKIRGYRIELGEIEATLVQQSSIRQAIVLAVDWADLMMTPQGSSNDNGASPTDQRLVAYYIPESGARVMTTEMRKLLRSRLPEFMIPQHFVELEAFPETPNGKVDRNALPSPFTGNTTSENNFAEPRTETEKVLARIWQDVLGIDRVGIHDNFFELGGNSLLVLQVILKTEKATGTRLPFRVLLLNTIEQIAPQCPVKSSSLEEKPVSGQAPKPLRPFTSRLMKKMKEYF